MELFNGIKYQDGSRIKEVPFPATRLMDALEIFSVGKDSPAYPGKGVRTTANIGGNQILGYYGGVYRSLLFGPSNAYAFDVENDFVVDALEHGNIFRYVNDPKPNAMFPNVRAVNVVSRLVKLPEFPFKVIQIRTCPNGIKAGEELLLDYHATDPSYWGSPVMEMIDVEEEVVVKKERFDLDGERDVLKRMRPPVEEDGCSECLAIFTELKTLKLDVKTIVSAWFHAHYQLTGPLAAEAVGRRTLLGEINAFLTSLNLPTWTAQSPLYQDWFIPTIMKQKDDKHGRSWLLYRRYGFAPHGKVEEARNKEQMIREIESKLFSLM